MGCCTRRHFLLTICTFQLITIIERQVFDFLGFMWAPILANFFHIIFVIFGFFGCYQFRAKYIITYAVWNLFWLGWNALLVCFYLSVGVLDKDGFLLNFGSVSWFESNGYGCQPVFSTNFTADVPVWPIRPERVDHCLLDYEYVEIGHSAVQLSLSVLALLGALLITKMFYDEDDRSTYKSGGSTKSTKSKHRQSLYSIEFSPPMDSIRGGGHHGHHGGHHMHPDDLLDTYDTTNDLGAVGGPPLSPKPMTPRRVKRRSVMTRGTSGRHSTTSRHATGSGSSSGGGGVGGTAARQSQRASRRKYHQSTVTKLMEQQQQQQQLQQQQQHMHSQAQVAQAAAAAASNHFQHNVATHSSQRRYPTFQRNENPALTESNLKYLNTDAGSSALAADTANPYGTAAGHSAAGSHSNHRYATTGSNASTAAAPPPPPDPIYYNMEPSNSAHMQHHSHQIQQQQQQQQHQQQLNQLQLQSSHMGHYNPTYQHSNPNLNTMPLDAGPPNPAASAEDLFAAPQHRPPSVRSSYSNFHGTRHLNSLQSTTTSDTENVFASLNSREQHQQQQQQQQQQQLYELQQNMNLPPPPPPLASAIASSSSNNSSSHGGGGGGGHRHQGDHGSSHSNNNHPNPAPPYLPPRKTASRESIRFLNNGPPAYNLNYHTPPDSETTM